jgi:hypothetical protein
MDRIGFAKFFFFAASRVALLPWRAKEPHSKLFIGRQQPGSTREFLLSLAIN